MNHIIKDRENFDLLRLLGPVLHAKKLMQDIWRHNLQLGQIRSARYIF